MSILKTTHTGSKAIHIIDEQEIIDEIAKLGYTYNYTLRCWSCRKNPLPDIVISNLYGSNSSNINIYVYYTISNPTKYRITTMCDLFNLIKELKTKCQF